MHLQVRRHGYGTIGGVRRQHRHGVARGRDRLGLGEGDFVGRHRARCGKAIEHAIARGASLVGKPIGAAQFGRLRQRHQQGRFVER